MIRKATPNDVPELVRMSAEMHREAPLFRAVPFSRDDTMFSIMSMIENPDRSCVFVDQTDEGMRGFIGGMMVPYFFNFGEFYTIDAGLYVDPIFRGTTSAYRLVSAYEDWARSMGVPAYRIRLGLSTNPDRKMRDFYLKMGYLENGYLYSKA